MNFIIPSLGFLLLARLLSALFYFRFFIIGALKIYRKLHIYRQKSKNTHSTHPNKYFQHHCKWIVSKLNYLHVYKIVQTNNQQPTSNITSKFNSSSWVSLFSRFFPLIHSFGFSVSSWIFSYFSLSLHSHSQMLTQSVIIIDDHSKRYYLLSV